VQWRWRRFESEHTRSIILWNNEIGDEGLAALDVVLNVNTTVTTFIFITIELATRAERRWLTC
jgi:hypothetical protein